MSPPVFVIDTNVVVAGLLTSSTHSPVASILDAMLSGTLIFLLSPALLTEFRSVLVRPRLIKLHDLTEAEIDRLLIELTANAIWCEPKPSSPAPDRTDDHLWALPHAYPGSILITGDQLLLEHPPQQSAVISPRAWLDNFCNGGGRTG